jgi:hypothetical protein
MTMVNTESKGLMSARLAMVADRIRTMACSITTGYGYWDTATKGMKAHAISELDIQIALEQPTVLSARCVLQVERYTVTGIDSDGRAIRILLTLDDEFSRFEIITVQIAGE